MATPKSHYSLSKESYLGNLEKPTYPESFEVRSVRTSGEIFWKSKLIYMTTMLTGELIGLEHIDEKKWQIWLSDIPVGILDENLKRVLPMYPG